jgi:hypothetical protein
VPLQVRLNSQVKIQLQTDASDLGWGACLLQNGKEIANCAQEWDETQRDLHITHREGLASALAVQHLTDHIPANCTLHIQADASSTVTTWNKGSKIHAMNKHILPQLIALNQKRVRVRSSHIAGNKNTRADYVSRQPDAKNYRLDPQVFLQMCSDHNYKPELDLFANRKNKQTKHFCSWRTDKDSMGNAWDINWSTTKNWLNPPLELIGKALQKLKQDKATALCCLPIWKTAPWWYQLQSLMSTTPTQITNRALYKYPQGVDMPAPKWGTLSSVLDASH